MIPDHELKLKIQRAAERLYCWQHGGTSFTCNLYSLMCQADRERFSILADAFPIEACALIAWRNSPTPEMFYSHYGMGRTA